jgi:prenyltransferase beta subunit
MSMSAKDVRSISRETATASITPKASASFWKAVDFLVRQYDDTIRAWGTTPGGSPDPWTTSQVLSLLASLSEVPTDVVEGATTFLLDTQNLDGSWGSITYSTGGDVPASAHAIIGLLATVGAEHLALQRGLDWLVDKYQQGWTTIPNDVRNRFVGTHFYSTAMATRALARAPRREIRSMCIQDAISVMLAAQNSDGGWGFAFGRQSDPTFTSYVLHGLVDAAIESPLFQEGEKVLLALDWLKKAQADEGYWPDWHGVSSSPESTGYAIYSLLRCCGVGSEEYVSTAVEWIVDQQQDDGGWLFDPTTESVSNNWVTFTVTLGLRAFIARQEQASSVRHQRGPLSIVDVDSLRLSRPLAPRPTTPNKDPILNRYDTYFPDQLRDLPFVRPLDHTMFDAIDVYVKQKIPEKEVHDIMTSGGKIELHQIYPDDFPLVATRRGWTVSQEITGYGKSASKRLNRVRPRFFRGKTDDGKERLWVAVTPGRDYLHHYGLMVRHLVSLRTIEWQRYMAIYRYPHAEREIVTWTGLEQIGLGDEDIVIVGFVLEIEQYLASVGGRKTISISENEYYYRHRFHFGKRQITSLGVKFSFWGSILGLITQALCATRCNELIYVGKLGALTSPTDIYTRVFCPSKFFRLRHAQVEFEESAPPNGVLARFPNLDSKAHVSVPTVLEEDYIQRGKATALNAQSIDNEIASVASAIGSWNRENSGQTAFACLHFATDYIRRPNERAVNVDYDLGRDKTEEARSRKADILRRITFDILAPYFQREAGH